MKRRLSALLAAAFLSIAAPAGADAPDEPWCSVQPWNTTTGWQIAIKGYTNSSFCAPYHHRVDFHGLTPGGAAYKTEAIFEFWVQQNYCEPHLSPQELWFRPTVATGRCWVKPNGDIMYVDLNVGFIRVSPDGYMHNQRPVWIRKTTTIGNDSYVYAGL